MKAAETQEPPGSSRFAVLFSLTKGTMKQRQWREGVLTVSAAGSYLRDTESHSVDASGVPQCTIIMSSKSAGLLPNPMYRAMRAAGAGARWSEGKELVMGPYRMQITTVLELHLLQDAAVGNAEERDQEESNTIIRSCANHVVAETPAVEGTKGAKRTHQLRRQLHTVCSPPATTCAEFSHVSYAPHGNWGNLSRSAAASVAPVTGSPTRSAQRRDQQYDRPITRTQVQSVASHTPQNHTPFPPSNWRVSTEDNGIGEAAAPPSLPAPPHNTTEGASTGQHDMMKDEKTTPAPPMRGVKRSREEILRQLRGSA